MQGMLRAAGYRTAAFVTSPLLLDWNPFHEGFDTFHGDLAAAPAEPGGSTPGETTSAFADLAAELDITVVVSLFERRAPGLFHNTAAVIDGRSVKDLWRVASRSATSVTLRGNSRRSRRIWRTSARSNAGGVPPRPWGSPPAGWGPTP